MKIILIAILITACHLIGVSQSLTFSDDTVIAYTCTNDPDMIGQLDMYNNTGGNIGVEWHIHYFDLPHNGIYALIMDGHQYAPFEDGHIFSFYEDTSQVYFYMWNDTLYAGDTSVMQIRVWNYDDSVATTTLLTAMKVCPVSTSTPSIAPSEFQLFPNPADDMLWLQTNQPIGDEIRITNYMGQTVYAEPFEANAMSINTSPITPGLYSLSVLKNGRIVSTRLFTKQ